MMKFTPSPSSAMSRKLDVPLTRALAGGNDNRVTVIIRVSERGYVPTAATERARMGEFILTAEVAVSDLESLEADPKVISIALGRKIPALD